MMTNLESAPSLASETRAIMRKGSKSFSLAALLFDRDSREGAELLYAWCRACDDAVDNEPDNERALAKLETLRAKTRAAFRNAEALDQSSSCARPAAVWAAADDITFRAFTLLSRKHGIEREHAGALLDGMQMDVEGAHIENDDDLKLYCYRVAGVVGLMMSKIMGVTDKAAYEHAVHTGLAMQMTNISRDVREDYDRGRTYIPTSWFAPREVTSAQLPRTALPFEAAAFAAHARRLVTEAEVLYASGEKGLKYLPLRSALAVGCAQAIYREIGRKVLARGARAWDTRTIVSTPRKVWLMTKTIFVILAQRNYRRA